MSIMGYLKEIFAPEQGLTSLDVGLDRLRRTSEAKVQARLASVRQAPTREAFDAWRDHPVTQFVFAAHRTQVDVCRRNWEAQSWTGGFADQRALDELRARADTYAALYESDYDAFCEAAGVEPRPED